MAANDKKSHFEPVGDIVSIFQRGRRWYANFQFDGRQHRPSLKTTSKKEARRRAFELEAEHIQGRYQRQPPPPPLAGAVESYHQLLRTEGRAKKTMVKYDKVCERLLALASRRRVTTLAGIDLKFMDAYRQERVEAGTGPKTLYNESTTIRQLVNFALSRKLIVYDPLTGLKLKKPKPTPQPCWTQEEVEKILSASSEPQRSQFLVLADTGMRVGELRHLTWGDVDFSGNVIHIRPKENWQPKTGDRRAIPMAPRVRSLLEGLPRRGDWVFCAQRSKTYPKGDHQISDRQLLASLKRMLAKLNLKGHVHTFRHAFISSALTRGTPEAIVRQWVGHVDAEILKLYTHIADTASQVAMQRLASADSQSLQVGGRQDGPENDETDSAQSQHSQEGASDAAGAS